MSHVCPAHGRTWAAATPHCCPSKSTSAHELPHHPQSNRAIDYDDDVDTRLGNSAVAHTVNLDALLQLVQAPLHLVLALRVVEDAGAEEQVRGVEAEQRAPLARRHFACG